MGSQIDWPFWLIMIVLIGVATIINIVFICESQEQTELLIDDAVSVLEAKIEKLCTDLKHTTKNHLVGKEENESIHVMCRATTD